MVNMRLNTALYSKCLTTTFQPHFLSKSFRLLCCGFQCLLMCCYCEGNKHSWTGSVRNRNRERRKESCNEENIRHHGGEITGQWMLLHNYKPHNLFVSLLIPGVIKW